MTSFYDSGVSQPVTGAARSFGDITVAEALRFPPSPARPTWMKSRFPVSLEEYHALKRAPRAAGRGVAPSLAAAVQGITVDLAHGVSTLSQEAREGETWQPAAAGAPQPAAPTMDASFDGIPQTA